jgi:predicted RNA-binding protein YlqC (UPF0109 family)
MEMKELIAYIAKALVDNPDAVEVSEVEGEQTSVIELKVEKSDLGKVIGKQGRTAQPRPRFGSGQSWKSSSEPARGEIAALYRPGGKDTGHQRPDKGFFWRER